MNQTPFYWNQPLADSLLETVLLVLAVAFLAWVIRLAFFDQDGN